MKYCKLCSIELHQGNKAFLLENSDICSCCEDENEGDLYEDFDE